MRKWYKFLLIISVIFIASCINEYNAYTIHGQRTPEIVTDDRWRPYVTYELQHPDEGLVHCICDESILSYIIAWDNSTINFTLPFPDTFTLRIILNGQIWFNDIFISSSNNDTVGYAFVYHGGNISLTSVGNSKIYEMYCIRESAKLQHYVEYDSNYHLIDWEKFLDLLDFDQSDEEV
jgi:hypothetical protein